MATNKLRMATLIEQESCRMLRDQGVSMGSAVMSEKKPPGTVGSNGFVLTTNVYGLSTKKINVFFYNVKVVGVTPAGTLIDYTDGVRNDAEKIERRAKCRDVISKFKEENQEMFGGHTIYYDLQQILYSIKKLDFITGEKTYSVEMPPGFNRGIMQCNVTISCVNENFELNLADLSKADPNLDLTDQTLQQFLNLATSQNAMFSPNDHVTFSSSVSYLLNPREHGFQSTDMPNFPDNGTYLAIGAKKGVRFVEGPKGMGAKNVAVVIETKKTPFHQVQLVSEKAECVVRDLTRPTQNGDIAKLKNLLKGLRVDTLHGSNRSYKINNVSRESARQKGIMFEERPITVEEYFLQRYGIILKYPNAPLLECKVKGTVNYFPMEVCVVADNQRVKSLQQTPRQVQEMIRKCAVVPSVLRDQNDKVTESLGLKDSNYLKEASIKFIPNNLNVKARVLPSPGIQYFGESVLPRTDTLTWQGRKFLIPAGCSKWGAYVFCGGQRDALSEQDLGAFVGKYLTECRSKGMQMPNPDGLFVRQSAPEILRQEIQLAYANKYEFVLMIHPDNQDDMHHEMKYSERKWDVTTQGLKITTVRNVLQKGQSLTVQNIVQKTNMKMGGLNYSLSPNSFIAKEILGTETLYIGFGMAHPVGGMGKNDEERAVHVLGNDHNGSGHSGNGHNGSGHNGNGINGHSNGHNGSGVGSTSSEIVGLNPVSVIGFSANCGRSDNFEFIGDFVYQKANRDEKANVIQEIVKRCVKKYQLRQNIMPKRVFIYRNGCSEGQFANILKYEVPLIKSSLESLSCKAKVTLMVCNKLQNVRFFNQKIDPRAKAPDQNIRPGTVIDSAVVHPCFTEFFLNSHRAIQGTARTPRYTVLYDDNQLTADQLQGITYHLSFGHQIVYMPTSLPSPVYIANSYSERGRNMHAYHLKVASADNDQTTYQELTERLGYEHTPYFADLRINA